MKRYRMYIFDLDGTLVDSLNGLKVCYKEALNKLGMECGKEDVMEFIRKPLRSAYEEFYNPDFSYEEFEKTVYREYGNTLNPNSLPYPDALPALKELKERGAVMCIATKSLHGRTREVLGMHGLLDCFDLIVGYDDVENHKPDPECLELCNRTYGFDKQDIVFVGDSDIDVIAAESFGIDSVFINREHNEHYEGTYNIEDLRELL